MVDDPDRRAFEAPQIWARLSPRFRAAHNRLRRARGELPIPEPKVDLYVPPPATSVPLPFDPADPEAVAAARDFLGLNEPAEHFEKLSLHRGVARRGSWEKRVAKALALELARDRLADRQLHKEVLHRAIAQFVALATRESSWNRKRIIDEAVVRYGVKARTIETAIAAYPEKFHFTDGAKRGLAVFLDLPIELRLLALGLPLPH
jgi:hypothetical protein